MRGRNRTLTIRTPEGITFPLMIADPVVRFLALAIDVACAYVVSALVSAVLGTIGVFSMDLAGAFWLLGQFLVSLAYPIVFEWYWRGQTVGKRLLRLRVMDDRGLRLRFSQIVIRNLLRCVDVLPAFYLVGGLACVLNSRGKRLGDVAANTIVVRQPRTTMPDLDQVLPGKFNSFRDYPHVAARLRQNVVPHAAAVALEALIRRDQLAPASRLDLFAQVRRHMEKAATFPQEATDGLSDEQYVRNAVDILFR